MKQNFYLNLFLTLFSVWGFAIKPNILFSQNNINRDNIIVRDYDLHTGWIRILLHEPELWGFIDRDSTVTIPFIYDFILPFEPSGITLAVYEGKYGFVNTKNEIVIPFVYDKLSSFSHSLSRMKSNEKFGYLNKEGEIEIPPIYDDARSFIECGIAAVSLNKKWGFINNQNEVVIPIIFDELKYNERDTLILALKNSKYAFFTCSGVQLSDFEFDEVFEGRHTDYSKGYTFSVNGLILVKKDYQLAYIDHNMKPMFPFGYFWFAQPFEWSRRAIASKDGGWGLIDEFGNYVLDFIYDEIKFFPIDKNLYKVNINGLWGLVDSDGNELLPMDYKEIRVNYYLYRPEKEGIIILKNNHDKYGAMDFNMNIIIPFTYDNLHDFKIINQQILARFEKGGKHGIIDIHNNQITPVFYDYILEIRWFDYYIVTSFEKKGIITKDGNEIFSLKFDEIEPCFYDSNNRFIVSKNGKYGIINIDKEVVIPIEFDEISNWVEYGPKEHFVVKNGKHGLIDREGNVVIPPIYDKIFVDNPVIIKVKKDGFYGVINWQNEIVHPIEYEQILWKWPYLNQGQLDTLYFKKNGEYFSTNFAGEIIDENISEEFIKEEFRYYLINDE